MYLLLSEIIEDHGVLVHVSTPNKGRRKRVKRHLIYCAFQLGHRCFLHWAVAQ